MYELAELAALQGRKDETLALLRRMVELGWADNGLSDVESFASLRDAPEFEAIVADVEKRLAGSDDD